MYVRPDGKQWFRFDDDRVEKADKTRALDEQFGGDELSTTGHSQYSGSGIPPPRVASGYNKVWDMALSLLTLSVHFRPHLAPGWRPHTRCSFPFLWISVSPAPLVTLFRLPTGL